MIVKFNETSSFDGRERKPVSATTVEDVTTALQEQRNCDAKICTAWEIRQMLDMAISTVRKISLNVLCCYLNNVIYMQQFLRVHLEAMNIFHYDILLGWKWTINCHGTFYGLTKPTFVCKILSSINTQNYRTWRLRIRSKYSHHLFNLRRSLCDAE